MLHGLLVRVDPAVSATIVAVHGIECASPPRIGGIPRIDNRGKIRLGHGVAIASGPRGNPVGGSTRSSIVVRPGAELTLGDGAGISNVEIYCAKRIDIGARTLVGGGTKIYDTDFHSLDPATRAMRPDPDVRVADVRIGSDVFIGAFSIILKGATVGDGAVVGAGSLVTGAIPAGEIWAGNPIRFVRKRA